MKAFSLLFLAAVAAAQPQACQPPADPKAGATGTATTDTSSTAATERSGLTPLPESLSAASCSSLQDAPTRGIACLHCLQPEAKAQGDALAQLLASTCLKNVAIDYLVDGSFSDNLDPIFRHVELLSSGGRHLLLHLYLMNGPAQRRHDTDPGKGFGANIAPADFRERIISDPQLRAEFQSRVTRLIPLLRYAASRDVLISIVPMLEDNLTEESFVALSQLVLDTLPADIPVALGRNPCGCSAGSDRRTPTGYFRESHDVNAAQRVHGGLVTNDGVIDALDLPDVSVRRALSLSDLQSARDNAAAERDVFILWGATRQGLYPNGSGSLVRQPPAARNYAIPEGQQRDRIIQFLRGE